MSTIAALALLTLLLWCLKGHLPIIGPLFEAHYRTRIMVREASAAESWIGAADYRAWRVQSHRQDATERMADYKNAVAEFAKAESAQANELDLDSLARRAYDLRRPLYGSVEDIELWRIQTGSGLYGVRQFRLALARVPSDPKGYAKLWCREKRLWGENLLRDLEKYLQDRNDNGKFFDPDSVALSQALAQRFVKIRDQKRLEAAAAGAESNGRYWNPFY